MTKRNREGDKSDGPSGRACIFCGQRPVRREHVLPAWLAKSVHLSQHHFVTTVAGAMEGMAVRRQYVSKTELLAPIRETCEACNSGWMSDLETLVEPLLSPMLHGTIDVQLTSVEQAQLSRRAFKTSLLLGYALVDRQPPTKSDLEWLRRNDVPPPDFYVLLAATGPEPPTARCRVVLAQAIRPDGTSIESTSRVVTIQVRHLVVQTVGLSREDGGRDEIRLTDAQIAQVVPLWPQVRDLWHWPPREQLDEDAMANFTENFTRARGFIRWLSPTSPSSGA